MGADFMHYETSAFARGREQRCLHNLNYWTFGDYLGIGADDLEGREDIGQIPLQRPQQEQGRLAGCAAHQGRGLLAGHRLDDEPA